MWKIVWIFLLFESLLLQPNSIFAIDNALCLALCSCSELWLVQSAFWKLKMNNQLCKKKNPNHQTPKPTNQKTTNNPQRDPNTLFAQWIFCLGTVKTISVLLGKSGLGSDSKHGILWLPFAVFPTQVMALQLYRHDCGWPEACIAWSYIARYISAEPSVLQKAHSRHAWAFVSQLAGCTTLTVGFTGSLRADGVDKPRLGWTHISHGIVCVLIHALHAWQWLVEDLQKEVLLGEAEAVHGLQSQ